MSIEVPIHYQNNLMDNFQNKKRNRSNEITWSFEEEFLFFEAHTFLGNKWKKYSQIIQK
jgi:hypothetical protein